jgi:hypothetical protein
MGYFYADCCSCNPETALVPAFRANAIKQTATFLRHQQQTFFQIKINDFSHRVRNTAHGCCATGTVKQARLFGLFQQAPSHVQPDLRFFGQGMEQMVRSGSCFELLWQVVAYFTVILKQAAIESMQRLR